MEGENEKEEIVKRHDTAGTRRWMTGSLVASASSHSYERLIPFKKV